MRSHETLHSRLNPDVSCAPEREPFLRCLLAGLFLNTARRADTASVANTVSSVTLASSGSRFSFSKQSSTSSSSSSSSEQLTAPYRTLRGRQMVHIHPSSVLFSSQHRYSYSTPSPQQSLNNSGSSKNSKQRKERLPPLVVFTELLVTSKQYMRTLTVVDESWLQEELTPDQLLLLR